MSEPRPPRMVVSWGRVPSQPCPRCNVMIHSAHGLSPDGPIAPRVGSLTLCNQCHTWLVFIEGVRLRLATLEEIERIDPKMRELAARLAAEGPIPGGRRKPS